MTPKERGRRKRDREEAERQRSRQAAREGVKRAIAEHGPIPEHILREVIRPALVEATAAMRANRSTRKGA